MDEKRNPWGEVVARALADEAFKERLIADPEAVLAAEGVTDHQRHPVDRPGGRLPV